MRTPLALIALPIAWIVACGEKSEPGTGATTGGVTTASGGATSGGVPSTGGVASGTGGTSSGSGGAAKGTGGASGAPSTGGSMTAGQSGAAGATGQGGTGGTAPAGGNAGKTGSGGVSGSAGAGSGGAPSGGAGGGNTTGGSAGGGSGAECTRELLKSTLDAYFVALAAHDPSSLPLAPGLKFTENSVESEIGEAGLWKTAGALEYAQSAFDTETCTVASQAVVPDGGTDIPLGLRLKLENQQITEIETIAVRSGDYALASNTGALIASGDSVGWDEPVPADQRDSAEDITAWVEKYFRMFPAGVCDTTGDCTRIENGAGSYNCSDGASCDPGPPGPGDNALTPRLIFADVESGLGVGFTVFTFAGVNTDLHFFKMYGGQVHGVSAILGAAGNSGWE